MTPLIDVIFLLLLFFMLTSTFSSFGEIELSQATSGTATQKTEPSQRLFMQLGPERIVLNGAEVTLADLVADLDARVNATAAEAAQTLQLFVSLDTETTAQRVVDLLVRLRGRDGLTVTVLE